MRRFRVFPRNLLVAFVYSSNEVGGMKPQSPKQADPFALTSNPFPGDSQRSLDSVASHGLIEFRFVLKFAAQLSTPCSRGLAIKPRAHPLLNRPAPRLFQSYLQRHSVLQ